MGIAVNGVDINDSAIDAEIAHHQQADNPLRAAVHEVVLRRVLLDEAARLGIIVSGSDDDIIEALFAREVTVPQADDEACLRYYLANAERFRSGDLVEARHILFQVTASSPLDLMRQTAEHILAELRALPERFAELAGQYSNCPSGAVGGSLGQLARGQCVPEFDELLFRLRPGELSGRLLETRFGLHIVQAQRRVAGQVIPFETVKAQIADELQRQSWQRALHQYLHILVGRADIAGVELGGAQTPLVQ